MTRKGWVFVKVMFAATKDQEEIIVELVNYLYSEIFPFYYEDEEISEFKAIGILNIKKRHFEKFSTLKEAYQVIASLQTIIAILEQRIRKPISGYYDIIFNQNVKILDKFNLCFPFNYSQFDRLNKQPHSSFSIYKKADNEILV